MLFHTYPDFLFPFQRLSPSPAAVHNWTWFQTPTRPYGVRSKPASPAVQPDWEMIQFDRQTRSESRLRLWRSQQIKPRSIKLWLIDIVVHAPGEFKWIVVSSNELWWTRVKWWWVLEPTPAPIAARSHTQLSAIRGITVATLTMVCGSWCNVHTYFQAE